MCAACGICSSRGLRTILRGLNRLAVDWDAANRGAASDDSPSESEGAADAAAPMLEGAEPIEGGCCRAPVRILFMTSRLLLLTAFADFEPPPSAEFIVRWLDESLRGLALAGNGVRSRARAAAEGELSFSPALPHAVALRCRAIRAAGSRLCEWADTLECGEQPEPMSRFTTDRLAAEAAPP